MLKALSLLATLFAPFVAVAEESHLKPDYPYVYHLVQARLWDPVVESDGTYYPPTYAADGFTHATANPAALMNVANHFYKDVDGTWYCLRMTEESLEATGVETIWEGTAPVGDIEPEFEGSDDELFPHILGGITPAAVLEVLPVERSEDGTFLGVPGVTD
ncbi:MAG: DUF952 domain-containing protein [Pseudohaliea sp.]